MKLQDLTNKKFTRLTVLYRAANGKGYATRWHCRCDCGNELTVHTVNLTEDRTKSCGCLHKEVVSRTGPEHPNYRHGQSGYKDRRATPAHKSWESMLRRCQNPKDKDYVNYGGRGIIVCERWQSFENFFADMGERPANMTLDRIKVNGNYEKNNCRWATPLTQAQNRRPYKTLSKFSDDDLLEECQKRGLLN